MSAYPDQPRRKRVAKSVADGVILRDGSYWAAVEYPRKADGSRDKRKFGPFISKSDAVNERDKRRHEARSGLVADPRKLTFDELADRWIEHKESRIPALSPATLRQYNEAVKLRLKPAFGNCALKKLTPMYVAEISSKLTRAERLDGRKGVLSDRSIQVTAGVLRALLTQAARWGLVSTDLSSAVESRTVKRDHIEFISSKDLKQLLNAAKADSIRTHAIFAVGLGCGLRRSELLGLQWRDIDFEGGMLRVERGVQKHEKKFHILPPKTKLSRRSLNIPAFALEALRSHYIAVAAERMKSGLGKPHTEHFTFGNALGEPSDPTWMSKLVLRIAKRADLPHVHTHSLRHGFATLQIETGTDLVRISKSMGHSTIRLTADCYAHVSQSLKKDAADQLNALVQTAIAEDSTITQAG